MSGFLDKRSEEGCFRRVCNVHFTLFFLERPNGINLEKQATPASSVMTYVILTLTGYPS